MFCKHPGRQPVLSPVRSSIEVGACSRSSMVMDLYDPSICLAVIWATLVRDELEVQFLNLRAQINSVLSEL